MKLPIYQVDAFAEKPFSGNPAAVCPLEEWLPDHTLQAIAEENNLSETAYYVKEGDSYRIRWFTPNKEVDLCGHATLAAAYVLFMLSNDQNDLSFKSRSGPLSVSKFEDTLTLNFPQQPGTLCDAPQNLSEALGKAPSECYAADDYMAVFESEADILSLEPDFSLLQSLQLRGVIATAPGESCDFVSRFFAPKYGIDEDPVTGSAHCTLTPYWSARLRKEKLNAQQLSKRRGHLTCEQHDDRILISGKAILYLEGSIFI
ncbi:PhzF family phenazine biosynthesis protein [Puniceicoccaceae bacterium K14]|nr:PhzF family phenazine biosynthesis protein [Puniceicoccaceae bacterium K14]